MNQGRYELLIAGYPLCWWTRRFKLPLHVLFGPSVKANVRAFRKVFQEHYPHGKICFAAKACAAVLPLIREEGAGADVASYNEARMALEAGIPPSMIDLNGNCKEDRLIREAVSKGMLIVADSIEEFRTICGIASSLGKKTDVVVRISGYPIEEATALAVFTAGTWTKFGVPLRDIPSFISSLGEDLPVNFCGFHTHIGSQIADLEPYIAVLGKMVEMSHLLKDHGFPCTVINIGGGFPVSYLGAGEWNQVLARVTEGYRKALSGDMSRIYVWHNSPAGFMGEADGTVNLDRWRGEKFHTPYGKEKMLGAILQSTIEVRGKSLRATEALKGLGRPLLIIEPGRSIVEDAGVTLAKVSLVKRVAGHHNLLLIEMGVLDHCEALTELILRRWMIAGDHRRHDKSPFEAFVGGNLCFSGDMLSRYKVSFQRAPARGDVVIIRDTGAYNSSFMAANANSFPRPDRVLVNADGSLCLLKKRDTYRQIFRLVSEAPDMEAFRGEGALLRE
ncbi:MAG: decarboxylase [Candidatus Eremiobacteraeota bacterium]|nr:decarboxylase [Candidatus Eremiobacteraeota bacterium]